MVEVGVVAEALGVVEVTVVEAAVELVWAVDVVWAGWELAWDAGVPDEPFDELPHAPTATAQARMSAARILMWSVSGGA